MILIYSNTGEWGGVDVLIARLAKYLSDRNRAFRILEPAGSRLRTQLPEKFFVDFCQVDGIAQQVTHVLFPSLAKLRDPNVPWHSLAHAYALAWIVHPNDVFRGFFPFSGRAMDLAGYKAGLWFPKTDEYILLTLEQLSDTLESHHVDSLHWSDKTQHFYVLTWPGVITIPAASILERPKVKLPDLVDEPE